MTDAHERIWASPEHPDEDGYGGFWIKTHVAPSVEYVRADILAQTLAANAALVKRLEEARGAVSGALDWDWGELAEYIEVHGEDQAILDFPHAMKIRAAILAFLAGGE